jgi:hypothetical protein
MKHSFVRLSIFISVSVFSMEMEEAYQPKVVGLLYPGQEKASHIAIDDHFVLHDAGPQAPNRMQMDYNWNVLNNNPPYRPFSVRCFSYECTLSPNRPCAQQDCFTTKAAVTCFALTLLATMGLKCVMPDIDHSCQEALSNIQIGAVVGCLLSTPFIYSAETECRLFRCKKINRPVIRELEEEHN